MSFEPGDPPRTGRVLTLPVGAAVPLLLAGSHADPAARTWAAATRLALDLIARGRLLPGVSPGGFDAWRVGALDPADLARIRELAADLGRADAEPLVRGYLDAVADWLPRTVAAAAGAGGPLFAAVEPQPVPHLRGWAAELAAGLDAGVRISLRVEMTDDDPAPDSLCAVLQVHGGGAGAVWTEDVLLALRRAARIWTPLERLLDQAVPDRLDLTDDEVAELLAGAAAELGAAGIDVYWPRELIRDLSVRAVVGRRDVPASGSLFGADSVLDVDWQVALGGNPLTPAELDVLAEAHRPVVRLRDRWLLVDPQVARRARERTRGPVPAIEALGAALSGVTDVDGERVPVASSGWLDAVRARIADPDTAHPHQVPAQPPGLSAELRGYQVRGLRWLARMTGLGLGACLADDMGLGKTITLIALHLHRQSDPATAAPTLVACPASLLGNWEREIRRFAPGTPVRRFHGPARSLDGDAAAGGFVLTTYATLRLDAARLARSRWGLVVADEAQHVKNPLSGTARALRTIPADARVALTGTPVENNLSDLWAILDWTTPGLLGTLGGFRTRWARPVEADPEGAAAERLARLVRPFLLRRRKADPDVAPELPAKTETDQPVALTHEQAALYEAAVRETMEQIRASAGIRRQGLVLKLLTALKQICNHPAQYLKEPRPRLAGRSGKLELLDELVDTIRAEGGAVLVFTQYVAMARLIERHLRDRGHTALLLHGGTPVDRREELVRRFQDGAVPVFLLSLKAAGTGLNLTRADHVIHYDRWWNPAVEEQATDRAHRIGQTRPVQVHRLIAEGTVEDRIAALLRSKRDLADAVLGTGEPALTELSDADLAALVELRS